MLNKDAFRVKENQHAFSHGGSIVSALVNITQTYMVKRLWQHNRRKKGHPFLIYWFQRGLWSSRSLYSFVQAKRQEHQHVFVAIYGYKAFSKAERNKLNFLVYYQQRGLARRVYHWGSVISPLLLGIFIDHGFRRFWFYTCRTARTRKDV